MHRHITIRADTDQSVHKVWDNPATSDDKALRPIGLVIGPKNNIKVPFVQSMHSLKDAEAHQATEFL